MRDYQYPDLRFIFEKGIPWEAIREARGSGEDYSREYLAALDNTASFCEAKVAPVAAIVDEEGCRLETDERGRKHVRVPQGILEGLEGLKEMGAFCGLTFPEEVGGLGFPLTVFFGIGEILSMGDSTLGLTPMLQEGVGHVLLEFGDERVIRDYLPRLMSGERICAMGLTEPGAGSDLASMKTTARPAGAKERQGSSRIRELEKLGEVYLLDGTKIFITNGFGDVLALARTEEGISMFLVAEEDKEVARIEKKMGIRGSATCEVLFDASPGVLVGELGNGLVPNMIKLMNIARLAVACQALGIAQRAHVAAVGYATEDRIQFGVHIVEHGPVRRILFGNEINLQATRALTYLAAYYFDLKESLRLRIQRLGPADPSCGSLRKKLSKYARMASLLIPMAKYDAAELANRVVYSSLQVFGGYGFTQEYPLERLYRDARITSIYEGTSQIQLREVFNEAYYLDKIGLLNQFKLGNGEGFVQTERNRLFIEAVLDEYAEEILAMEGAGSSIRELLEGVREMRDCLKVSRQELFLHERKRSKEDGRLYLSLYHEEYVNLLARIFKGYALARQASMEEYKEKVARAYIEEGILEAGYLRDRIQGRLDELAKDQYHEIVRGYQGGT